MFRRYYSFGGVAVLAESTAEFDQSPHYEPFSVPETRPDHIISVRLSDLPEDVRPGAQRHWTEDGTLYTSGGYAVCAHGHGRTDIVLRRDYEKYLTARVIFEAAELSRILARFGAVVLHASFITVNGRAILFSAPSGTGKSTQAELWRVFEGAEIINGDRALVRCTPGGAAASGVCYCGTSGICRNGEAPLASVVLLGQAKENRVRRVPGKEAFAALLSQSSYREWDAEAAENVTETVAKLVSSVPVYRLDCLPDRSAVDTLKEVLRSDV